MSEKKLRELKQRLNRLRRSTNAEREYVDQLLANVQVPRRRQPISWERINQIQAAMEESSAAFKTMIEMRNELHRPEEFTMSELEQMLGEIEKLKKASMGFLPVLLNGLEYKAGRPPMPKP